MRRYPLKIIHSGFFGPCTEDLQPCSVRFGSSVRVTVSDLRMGCTLAEAVLVLLSTVRSAFEIKGIIKMQFATQKSKHVYKINTVLFFNPLIVYHSGCLYSACVSH